MLITSSISIRRHTLTASTCFCYAGALCACNPSYRWSFSSLWGCNHRWRITHRAGSISARQCFWQSSSNLAVTKVSAIVSVILLSRLGDIYGLRSNCSTQTEQHKQWKDYKPQANTMLRKTWLRFNGRNSYPLVFRPMATGKIRGPYRGKPRIIKCRWKVSCSSKWQAFHSSAASYLCFF